MEMKSSVAGGGVLSANLIYVNEESEATLACGTDFTCSSGRVNCKQPGIYEMSVTTYGAETHTAQFNINGKGGFVLKDGGTLCVFVQLVAGDYILFSSRVNVSITVSLARVA